MLIGVSVARGHSGALAVRSRLTRPELTVPGAGLCRPADSLLIGERAARMAYATCASRGSISRTALRVSAERSATRRS